MTALFRLLPLPFLLATVGSTAAARPEASPAPDAAASAFIGEAQSDERLPHAYDVVVYGGSSGGLTAAIQVARMGKSVALIEPSAHVGGMSVEGLGGTDIDNHGSFQNSPAVGGLALEFYRRIARAYDRLDAFDRALATREKNPGLWRFESYVAQRLVDEWLAEYPIAVFRNQRLKEGDNRVEMVDGRIRGIAMESGARFEARVFVDATIVGDLLHAAGVSTVVGREPNALYGEVRNGIRGETTHAQFLVTVDPYIEEGNPSSGVIPTIQDDPLGKAGDGDHRIQAYCFRVCLTQADDNKIPFRKPANYDRGQYEIYLRYLRAGGRLYTPRSSIPNGKTDLGAWHDLSHNLYGMNHGYPSGSYKEREEIVRHHRHFTEGLFYFLSHDEEVGLLAPALRKEWASWGLAKDEFQDNEGWPRQFYVRDARRMVSDYVITEHHIKKEGAIVVEDPVALAFWPPDVHSVRRIAREGKAYNEGFVFGGNWWKPFGISYRALVPKASECTNLLTPTCPSSSHIAYGALRIEFTFMALGQAAGTAAAIATENNIPAGMVRYAELESRLLQDGQVLKIDAH